MKSLQKGKNGKFQVLLGRNKLNVFKEGRKASIARV
jgi:hypothetical protein